MSSSGWQGREAFPVSVLKGMVKRSAACGGIKVMTDIPDLGIRWVNEHEVGSAISRSGAVHDDERQSQRPQKYTESRSRDAR